MTVIFLMCEKEKGLRVVYINVTKHTLHLKCEDIFHHLLKFYEHFNETAFCEEVKCIIDIKFFFNRGSQPASPWLGSDRLIQISNFFRKFKLSGSRLIQSVIINTGSPQKKLLQKSTGSTTIFGTLYVLK